MSTTTEPTGTDAWVDIWPSKASTRGEVAVLRGTVRPGVASIRIFSKVQGYLNVDARRLLFDGAIEGWIRYQTASHGGVSMVAVPEAQGYRVGKSGHINVAAITERSQHWPVSYRLSQHPTEPHRLVFTERLEDH